MDDLSLSAYLPKPAERSTAERIRDAALESFATRGIAETSMRQVAEHAGVSVGFVQRSYGTKAALRAAVDQHVLSVIAQAVVSSPLPGAPADPLEELGHRVVSIVRDHPDVVGYVGRALLEGDDLAFMVFDNLVALSSATWDQFEQQGLLRNDLDRTWAALHSVVLMVGTAFLRAPIERHLPEPFTTPSQLSRWDRAMYVLLRSGMFEHDADPASG
jgi:TetR/AcrR family transcriptional regulator, regulator of cefoperazone and chloramphenicol sensitivity